MEIILKQDVANLGHKDDIVKVRNGYAVNYLIPQGMAILATESAKRYSPRISARELTKRPRSVKRPAHSLPRSTESPLRLPPR